MRIRIADRYETLKDAPATGDALDDGDAEAATSEGDAAIQIYTDYFGPLPTIMSSLTQQTACNYGQSWPMLVYLPICYFWDATIKHRMACWIGTRLLEGGDSARGGSPVVGTDGGVRELSRPVDERGVCGVFGSLFLMKTKKDRRSIATSGSVRKRLLRRTRRDYGR